MNWPSSATPPLLTVQNPTPRPHARCWTLAANCAPGPTTSPRWPGCRPAPLPRSCAITAPCLATHDPTSRRNLRESCDVDGLGRVYRALRQGRRRRCPQEQPRFALGFARSLGGPERGVEPCSRPAPGGRAPATGTSRLGGRPSQVDLADYRERHTVECGITRFDKLAVRYLATVHVAAINEWL